MQAPPPRNSADLDFGPATRFVVGFSGGKDSVAAWLRLRDLGAETVVCTFADTGHEAPETYAYLEALETDHGLPLARVRPTLADVKITEELARERLPELGENWRAETLTMERLAVLKRRFPSPTRRFCTDSLKLRPMLRWHSDNPFDGLTVRVSGVRAEESPARAKRPAWSFDELFGLHLWLPIHDWTHEEVFAVAKRHGVPPNPLYRKGCGRVGCFPCVMSTKTELKAIASRTDGFDRLVQLEANVNASAPEGVGTFFSVGKVPPRHATGRDPKSGKAIPTAEDVRRWATGEPPPGQGALPFEDDWTEDAQTCQSMYGLCE